LPNGLAAKAKIDALVLSKADVDLPASALPMLIRFRNSNESSSAEVVDPDDLALVFGDGVKIVRVKAEITNEPVTSGIDSYLPWLKSGYREKYLFTAAKKITRDGRSTAMQNVTYGDLGVK
jgi:hypothetical protein